MKIQGVHDKELALWFIAKGCTLDEANCFADETIHEIENAKDYETYQDERLGNLIIDKKAEVSKRFTGYTNKVDKELALWFMAKGFTLDEANYFSEETIREIDFAKDYEAYQEERLGNLIIGQKVEVSKRFIGATNQEAAILS